MKDYIDQRNKELEDEFPDIFHLPEGGMSVWLEESYTNELKHFQIQTIIGLLEKMREELERRKKEYPPNIKQEIWGGEGGLPNTIIESPNVFGIKIVDGYNSALQDQISHIDTLIKELKANESTPQ